MRPLVAAVGLTGLLVAGTACTSDEDEAATDPICGVIDPALVTEFTSKTELSISGDLAADSSQEGVGECQVRANGDDVLLAVVDRLAHTGRTTMQNELLENRKAMRRSCPDPRFIGKRTNICVDDEGQRRVLTSAMTDTLFVSLTIRSTVRETTPEQALAIVEDIDAKVG